ncbi:hypothetical protein DO97_00045 [Neosynechococcus sphagnicola sy1]|uniref:Rqc2 homolog RqcH n=1 Tax=Neosynechococcus sphagnicola sy1 TaxID=1497020 RepID=A0A098TNR4_9CYAN|nr:NFACT RNA binding domain-containing protein [Neosynechococcus sphagnicola]KGF73975.1 hypothetical protein DO97_00045 [Neosynechococcus sphagnicola sy1]
MQPVDYTTLAAACWELQTDWLPARLEQVCQRDRHTVCLALRTLNRRGWLTLSWHPQAARICMADPPPRAPDTFTFSQQLRHQLQGLALISLDAIAPWERVFDLQFAHRPDEPALWHLYIEIMGKYSNLVLTNADQLIITAAHQVNPQQSSIRPIQTGQPYEAPPALTDAIPTPTESLASWQDRISLIPGALAPSLLKSYRGLSKVLVASLVQTAELQLERSTASLNAADWQRLYQRWQAWLDILITHKFQPGWTAQGYTVLGWGEMVPSETIQELLNRYYSNQLHRQDFQQLRHQLFQKVSHVLGKLQQKAATFEIRLQQSAQAEAWRHWADLLMAHLQHWQPGLRAIALPDFTTGEPMIIPLNPEKNAVQNAQWLYKQHQKLKRARVAVEPLLQQVQTDIAYLQQVEVALTQLEQYQQVSDLWALQEIRAELVQQGYLEADNYTNRSDGQKTLSENRAADIDGSLPHRYQTPSGFEVLVGRNNRQNDHLTFRLAGDYDLWFHTQEIPGSHVLLRLPPGRIAEETDLQVVADLAAYYSRARQSQQVPVVYTQPRYVFKPKGAKPGMAIYQKEQICWGRPAEGAIYAQEAPAIP